MSVILIDGPEKAGKSTVIREIQKLEPRTKVRRWGPVSPDDRVYSEPLERDIKSPLPVVWDRGWPSEFVYSTMLDRDRRLRDDPWLGEWIHGRALQTEGVRCILLGPGVTTLARNRDETDLPVDPRSERELYSEYGRRFHYMTFENEHTEATAREIAESLFAEHALAIRVSNSVGVHAPWYAGPPNAPVVFVGERMGNKRTVKGAWLPLSSRLTTMLGRDLGDDALKCGWTNAADCPPQVLRDRRAIVACGTVAQKWVHYHVRPSPDCEIVNIDHPAFIYRWKTPGKRLEERLAAHRETLTRVTKEYLR